MRDLTSTPGRGLIAGVMRSKSERRRYGRIKLDEPLRARYGEMDVRVIEVSVSGFLIAHEGRLASGQTRPLVIDAIDGAIALEGAVVRSTLYRLSKALGEKSLYHTGLRVVSFSGDSFVRLRALIGERIVRALEEQKANARGIPPLFAYMYQPEKGELYRRCEYVDGGWRKSETIRPLQPASGFTISADVDPEHVEMLCETWEQTTAEGRRLTQLLAELSISKAEGVPTRRYIP